MQSSTPTSQCAAPQSIDEGEQRKDRLLELIQEIDAELSDKNVSQPGFPNRRMNEHDYHQWRARQVLLKKDKLAEYRFLKRWLADESRKQRGKQTAKVAKCLPSDHDGLLKAAHDLLRHFASQLGWRNITDEHQQLIDGIRDYLQNPSVFTQKDER